MNLILKLTSGLVLSVLGFSSARAEGVTYRVGLRSDGTSGVKFSIPHKAGIHHGLASAIVGEIITNSSDQLLSAEFEVPIASLSTNNATRDCHMREALGINYQRSRFPNEHVCNDDNQIPTAGPDAIAFPKIALKFLRLDMAPTTPLPLNQPSQAKVQVTLQLHGHSKDIVLPVMVTKRKQGNSESLQLAGKFDVALKDFGVIVKPLKLGPIVVTVGERATVEFDILANEL